MTIKVVVNGQSLSWYDRSPKIAADSIEFVEFQFLLSEDWEGYEATAQFSQKGQTYNKLLVNNCCKLPMEIKEGKCFISVFGQIPGGPERATVVPLVTTVSHSGFVSDGRTPIPPTPDLYSQLIEYFSSLVGTGGTGGNSVSPSTIAAAVENYLAKNPPKVTESDPTVSNWAKQPQKPTYTATEVGAVTPKELSTAVDAALKTAKDSGEFDGDPGVYILAEGETLEDVPENVNVVIDPFGEADTESSSILVDRTTGAKYNLYVDNGKLKMEKEE